MKASVLALAYLAFALFAFSCQPQPTALTDAQKATIADSVKAVLQTVVVNANRLDFNAALQSYAPDGRYVENGAVYTLDEMKKGYADFGPMFESIENVLDTVEVIVLGPDAASITSRFHFSFKPKGGSAYIAQGGWSLVFQRRAGSWVIVQSHESWVNAEQAMAAMAPPPPPKSKK